MRYKVLKVISFISFVIITCDGVGISSKLDFGDSHSSPKLVGIAPQHRSVSVPFNYVKKEETKVGADFEGIGVVCISGDCNKRKPENESSDSVKTDILVHVKTTVDLNQKNKTNFVDDTPDVPIIVGTAGTDAVTSQSRAFKQRPLVSDFNTFSSPGPFFSSAIAPTVSSSISPSFIPSYSTFSSPGLPSDTVYVHSPGLSSEPRVDINIKTLPSVSLTMTNDPRGIKDVRYKANGIELHYPYFEPSFHNHYFGESPPPQLGWYPKRSDISNKVDYKPKPAWKPSQWSGGSSAGTPHRHIVGSSNTGAFGTTPHRHTVGSGNTCPCKNQPNTGLQWHSTHKVYEDPGRQIDDKLSKLS